MSDHTPEPWEYLDDPPRIVSQSHPEFCIAQYVQEGNARRMIAAVHAVRGIPTEHLNDQFWRAVELCASHANWCRNEAVGEASDLLLRLARVRKEAIGGGV